MAWDTRINWADVCWHVNVGLLFFLVIASQSWTGKDPKDLTTMTTASLESGGRAFARRAIWGYNPRLGHTKDFIIKMGLTNYYM